MARLFIISVTSACLFVIPESDVFAEDSATGTRFFGSEPIYRDESGGTPEFGQVEVNALTNEPVEYAGGNVALKNCISGEIVYLKFSDLDLTTRKTCPNSVFELPFTDLASKFEEVGSDFVVTIDGESFPLVGVESFGTASGVVGYDCTNPRFPRILDGNETSICVDGDNNALVDNELLERLKSANPDGFLLEYGERWFDRATEGSEDPQIIKRAENMVQDRVLMNDGTLDEYFIIYEKFEG